MKVKKEENTENEVKDAIKDEGADDTGASSAEPTAPPIEETESLKESVVLKGWYENREGAHTIHIKEGIFKFINGKAEFSSEAAEALRQAGYIE